MPELPEIEVLRRELSPTLVGRCLRRVRSYRQGLRDPFAKALLSLRNTQVLFVNRRGKYLQVEFKEGTAYIHLGMSGQLIWVGTATPPGKHDHLDLLFDDGRLRLRDPRRFGTVLWQPAGDALPPAIARMGLEPLSRGFSGRWLVGRLGNTRRPVKAAIMDSQVLVGVGNIYASEALFDASLAPMRPCSSLSDRDWDRLAHSIVQVLRKGIRLGGSSMRDYVHADGSLGGFLAKARVYGRVGQPCPVCSHPLATALVGGRNTPWCPHCQKG